MTIFKKITQTVVMSAELKTAISRLQSEISTIRKDLYGAGIMLFFIRVHYVNE